MKEEDLEQNKLVVRRFNKEILEQLNPESFKELMHDNFINHTPPPGNSDKADGVWNNLKNILNPAFPDLEVEIYDQIAEGDKVVTRKAIIGTHTGKLLDIEPTGRKIKINVIDIVTVKDGQYLEHWGINTLQSVIAELRKP
jgi:predicted ester cyclase